MGQHADRQPRPRPAPKLTVTATKTELTAGESATLTVTAANIDPSCKLEWNVQQSRTVVNLTPYGGAKANLSARAEGTAAVTVQAKVAGRIVAEQTVTIQVDPVPPEPPVPTPTPKPEADFSEISIGNGTLSIYTLDWLGVSHDAPFDYTIRFVEFDSAFDCLTLSGEAQSRVDAVLSGWEA